MAARGEALPVAIAAAEGHARPLYSLETAIAPTSSPWIVESGGDATIVRAAASGRKIAVTGLSRLTPRKRSESREAYQLRSGRHRSENEANARLIAAAPDLFDALQACVASVPAPGAAISPAVAAQARTAIAKARGSDLGAVPEGSFDHGAGREA